MESHIIYLAFIEQLWFMVLIMSFLYLHTKPIQTLNTFGLDFLSLPIFFWTNHVASPILLSTSLTHIVWAMLTSISKECWFLTTWTVSHQRDFLATSFRIVNDAGRLIFPFLFFFFLPDSESAHRLGNRFEHGLGEGAGRETTFAWWRRPLDRSFSSSSFFFQ